MIQNTLNHDQLTSLILGMQFHRFRILMKLKEGEHTPQSALLKITGLSKAALTGIRDAMYDDGLIDYFSGTLDRRTRMVTITPLGIKALELFRELATGSDLDT